MDLKLYWKSTQHTLEIMFKSIFEIPNRSWSFSSYQLFGVPICVNDHYIYLHVYIFLNLLVNFSKIYLKKAFLRESKSLNCQTFLATMLKCVYLLSSWHICLCIYVYIRITMWICHGTMILLVYLPVTGKKMFVVYLMLCVYLHCICVLIRFCFSVCLLSIETRLHLQLHADQGLWSNCVTRIAKSFCELTLCVHLN